jgi:hypothetical protein
VPKLHCLAKPVYRHGSSELSRKVFLHKVHTPCRPLGGQGHSRQLKELNIVKHGERLVQNRTYGTDR